MDSIRLKLRFSRDGLTPETLGWPALRELIDVSAAALAGLGGFSTRDVQLLDVRPGSVVPVLGLPPEGREAARRLATGPTRRWSLEQRASVEPLYTLVRANGYTMQLGARVLRPVPVPPAPSTWETHERTSLRGVLQRVGGPDGAAVLVLDHEGTLSVKVGRDMALALAPHLYSALILEVEATRDGATGVIKQLTLQSFEPAPPKLSAAEAFRRLDEAVGGWGAGFDVLGAARRAR